MERMKSESGVMTTDKVFEAIVEKMAVRIKHLHNIDEQLRLGMVSSEDHNKRKLENEAKLEASKKAKKDQSTPPTHSPTFAPLLQALPPALLFDEAKKQRLNQAYDKAKEGLAKAEEKLQAVEAEVSKARGHAIAAKSKARDAAKERVDEAKEVVASAKEMLDIMGIVVEEDERVESSQG